MSKSLQAEWERHGAIIIAWPSQKTDWQENLLKTKATYIELANQIADHQKLIIISDDSSIKNEFSKSILKNIRIILCEYNDTWTRDYIGLSVKVDNNFKLMDFKFNGWGEKYKSEKDNSINVQLYEKDIISEIDFSYNNLILEGGSIDSNGRGTILTTSKCLLNKNRNSNLSKQEIESMLFNSLGIEKILWINHGEIPGDDTDSHIDNLARFCSENKIVYATDDSLELSLMEQELKKVALENNYELVPIPLPKSRFFKKKSLPASYINFIITNDKVLVPIFGDTNDNNALSILRNVFPNRIVTGINSVEIIKQKGSLHCLTMQINENLLNLSIFK
jgi:agmatine/peptidylarginine deiminase